MKKTDLLYTYPEELIAKEPVRPSRICGALNESSESLARELSWDDFLNLFKPGDVLVMNNTKVLKRRVFSNKGLEILFLQSEDLQSWNVLFPSRKLNIGSTIELPGEVTAKLIEKGRPQKLLTSRSLEPEYFENFGELPLPPYIQKARLERHTQMSDTHWYQTAWSERPGSFAAPTASLHFNQGHLKQLKDRGVSLQYLTLHVGLGTFLPVEVEDLRDHNMHEEEVEISVSALKAIKEAKEKGHVIWAMGTTVTRALEAWYLGHFKLINNSYLGKTNLLILPGYEFKIVDNLLTNFHQPESTLLALVMAFAGVERVKHVYQWAIKNRFSLFSYGDLSVWRR